MRPRLLLLLVIMVISVVGCGGAAAAPSGVVTLETDDASARGSEAPSPSVDPEEAFLAFARCMRENGIDMPDPGSGTQGTIRIGGEDGVDPEQFEAANEACREHLAGVAPQEGPQLSDEQRDAMLAFARCMREQGIDMPDPDENGAIVVPMGGEAPDMNDGAFRAAEAACREHLGDAPGGGGILPGPGAGGDGR